VLLAWWPRQSPGPRRVSRFSSSEWGPVRRTGWAWFRTPQSGLDRGGGDAPSRRRSTRAEQSGGWCFVPSHALSPPKLRRLVMLRHAQSGHTVDCPRGDSDTTTGACSPDRSARQSGSQARARDPGDGACSATGGVAVRPAEPVEQQAPAAGVATTVVGQARSAGEASAQLLDDLADDPPIVERDTRPPWQRRDRPSLARSPRWTGS
jgi:hypothetical protein